MGKKENPVAPIVKDWEKKRKSSVLKGACWSLRVPEKEEKNGSCKKVGKEREGNPWVRLGKKKKALLALGGPTVSGREKKEWGPYNYVKRKGPGVIRSGQ